MHPLLLLEFVSIMEGKGSGAVYAGASFAASEHSEMRSIG
jgi:hypothetical protein